MSLISQMLHDSEKAIIEEIMEHMDFMGRDFRSNFLKAFKEKYCGACGGADQRECFCEDTFDL